MFPLPSLVCSLRPSNQSPLVITLVGSVIGQATAVVVVQGSENPVTRLLMQNWEQEQGMRQLRGGAAGTLPPAVKGTSLRRSTQPQLCVPKNSTSTSPPVEFLGAHIQPHSNRHTHATRTYSRPYKQSSIQCNFCRTVSPKTHTQFTLFLPHSTPHLSRALHIRNKQVCGPAIPTCAQQQPVISAPDTLGEYGVGQAYGGLKIGDCSR